MEFLRKKYAEPVNLTRLEANLVPSSLKRKPLVRQKPEFNESDKYNGLDDLTDLLTKTDRKTNKIEIQRPDRPRKPSKNLLIQGRDEPLNNSDNCVLHIGYNDREAALVCQVRTANFRALKQRLSSVFQNYNCRFRAVHSEKQIFKQMGLIHVLMTCQTAMDFGNLEEQLHQVALSCHAEGCRIVSHEMGALCFRCQPELIPEVACKLKVFGYTPLLTELGYCPIGPLVKLKSPQLRRYSEFLKNLRADADIVKVYDNVQNSVLQSMYTS
ncbi:PREDICTED: uncharacterized protein LOC108608647 [Drosophila arizonae]|uniref:Uncharacterized protein LOC108608647 n=1 Tax=Drosophila arizonae TaxID=7263 RepID=A0ABM1NKW9_DROAR|nr:PREDICTED: uncharacterized protein LOC108608647 [Drosophila arizonae]